MSTTTIEQTIIPNCRFTGTGIKLRIFLPEAFITSDGTPLQSSSPQVNRWYKQVDCTLNGTSLTIPEFSLDSTVDGLDIKTRRYVAYFFRGNTNLGVYTGFEDGFKVPATPVSWSWADLRTYNFSISYPPGDISGFYTKDQTNFLLDQISGGAPNDAAYWMSSASAELSNGVNLGLLNTGLVKVSVSGAVATPMTATAETDYVTPSGVGTLSNKTLSAPIVNVGSDAIGDTYYRNAGGMFTRRGIGSSGQVLTVSGGLPVWSTPSSGFADPMTTIGDVIIRDGTNTTVRLGIGTSNQVLTVSGGVPIWATPASGFSDPMTTRGDLIFRNSSNTTARLAAGAANRYLGSDGTDIAYSQVSLSAGVTGTLPIANGGTGSTTRNFVQTTGNESVAGTKTWTSNSVFLATTANEAAWGAAGATTSMFQGADTVADSAVALTGGNPSISIQSTRTGGALGNSSIAYGFAVYSTSRDDNYGVYSLIRHTTNLSGLSGTQNITAGRSYVLSSPTNVGGSMNVNNYGHWIQAERLVAGIRAVGAQIDVNNSAADATVAFANIDTTFCLATNYGAGGHNTGIWYSQGASSTSAYCGWYVDSNAVCQRVLDFTAASVTLQGTWTASAATTVTGSGGHANVELVAGDIISVNGTLCTVASAIANTITLTASFAGTPASGLTITKKVQPAWFANNTYLWWNNAAASARYRLGGLGTDDRFALDPDARGVTFGSYTSFGTNAIHAPWDTLTSGWRHVLYEGGSGANYGFGIESGSLWCMAPAGYKVYISSSSAPVLGMTVSSTGIISFLTTTVSDSSGKILAAALNTIPISTGISGLGTGVATFLGTPSSANLLAAVTDETGTGALVFGTSPTFTTQITSPVLYGGSANTSTLALNGTSHASPSSAHIAMNTLVSGSMPGIVFIGAATSTSTINATGITESLHIGGTNSGVVALVMDSYGNNTVGNGSALVFRNANGTVASPAASALNDAIAIFGGRPHDGTSFVGGNRSAITFKVSEPSGITSGNQGMFISLEATPRGTTSRIQRELIGLDKNLTDAATSLFEVALPDTAMAGGIIQWTIVVADATPNYQVLTGITTFAMFNKGGTYTKQFTTNASSSASVLGSGTLSATFSGLDGTDKVTIQVTPSGSLTETTYKIYYKVTNNSPKALTLV